MTGSFSLRVLQAQLTTEFIGRTAVHLPSAASTMDVASEEAESGAPEGLIVVADEQTRGQGRRGRGWISPPGNNVYVTIVLRPSQPEVHLLSMIAPLAVCEAVEAAGGPRAWIKWPNDVLVGGKKLSGVLIHARSSEAEVEYALVGIGVNVNLEPSLYPEIAGTATSLFHELGREVPRETLLAALLNAFERLYKEARGGGGVLKAWKERLETLGRRIQVRYDERLEEGTAEDVDPEGNLVLRRDDGSYIVFAAGDVTLSV